MAAGRLLLAGKRPPKRCAFRQQVMGSDFRLLSHFQGVVNLDTQIPNRALKFGMAEQQLDGPEVLRSPVDERCFRSA